MVRVQDKEILIVIIKQSFYGEVLPVLAREGIIGLFLYVPLFSGTESKTLMINEFHKKLTQHIKSLEILI